MAKTIDRVLALIREIRTYAIDGQKAPHKFVFLLSLARLYGTNPDRKNAFALNDEIESVFKETWFEFLGYEARRNAIELPFYHLQTDGFWTLQVKEDKQVEYATLRDSPNHRLTKNRLLETVDYGYLDADFHDCLDDEAMRTRIVQLLMKLLKNTQDVPAEHSFERLVVDTLPDSNPNTFVMYLNSLHCRDAGSENALAESQACNPWFGYIQVPHPLVAAIKACLIDSTPGHVILTGHAGDGKSTIALELYRELRDLPFDQALASPLKPREDICLPDGKQITIAKDLSEWGEQERIDLLSQVMAGDGKFLLVSNTGTLLDLFCEYSSRKFGRPRAESEPEMLEAISSDKRFDLRFGDVQFAVFNLALLDNLPIANKIFDRMLSPDRWSVCKDRHCSTHCPIYRNVALINEHKETTVSRIFMAYRRMYEYGTRLTLRQLTAHLAYILTSGLEHQDILALSERLETPLMSEFMFYNRFFGDNGKTDDTLALQLRAIKEIRRQGFGERPCPTWERRLWLLTRDKYFSIDVPVMEEEFDKLRRYGSGAWNPEDRGLSPDQARDQVRRMLYFLYRFSPNDDVFIREFLGSPAIMKWWTWQNDEARLSLDEAAVFKGRIFHVLQEQFTGIRLPEGNMGDQKLYITLSRHKHEIRQSAQVVLAQIDFGNEFSLELNTFESGWSNARKDLCLMGRGRLKGVNMSLTLPFLDYVLMRNCGETGEVLHAAYSQRLERLKARLLELGDGLGTDDMLLVRLRTNHTFLRQKYAIHKTRLEVANA